jgi:serine/threonine protein phosphatase PrpC
MTLAHLGTLLKAAGYSHPGLQRSNNEDRYHYDSSRGIFIVIDGIGGQAAGETAAETALRILRSRLERETGAIEDRVREAIALANNEIHRLASIRSEWQGMACVLTVAVVTNGDVIVGHVGDTRLYKLRGGRLEKLTRDHSPVGEREDGGELTEHEAMQHPRRNEVYRDVGSEPHDPRDPDFIDVVRHPLEQDAALLLCSDGLTDAIGSSEIAEVVRSYAGHPHEVVRALVAAANEAGGKDNVTAVYAEGARFASGDETRDLRTRQPMAAPAPAAFAPRSLAEPMLPAPSRARRWRLAALVVLTITAAAMAMYTERDRIVWPDLPAWIPWRTAGTPPARPIVRVQAGQSISAAIDRAANGEDVVVDPGEYRERVILKQGLRLVSRVPHAAILRLPGGATENAAAVVAAEIAGATLSGFRILGDAATPLGTGVAIRNAEVTLSDIEIVGAQTAAIEYSGASAGSVLASSLHDNPGIAIVIRSNAFPRVAGNSFVRNATSERAAGTLLIEADARPTLSGNTFVGVRPESLIVPSAVLTAIERDNWFISAPGSSVSPAPRPSTGPGQRSSTGSGQRPSTGSGQRRGRS